MKKEKQLEFNVKGISNQEELNKNMKDISDDATKKLEGILTNIIYKTKYTKKDLENIISLSKWINSVLK